jgi:AraC-like DNA-binding protein
MIGKARHIARSGMSYDGAAMLRLLNRLIDQMKVDRNTVIASAGLRPLRAAALNRLETSRLFEAIVLTAENTAFERRLISKKALPRDGFRMMCFSLIACPTLRDAIDQASRFFSVFTDAEVNVGCATRGKTACFYMNPPPESTPSALSFLLTVAGLRAFLHLFSWLIGEDLKISEALVRQPPEVVDASLSSSLLGVKIRAGQPDNGFAFDDCHLSQPIIRSYKELVELVQFFPFDLMHADYEGWLLAERVQSLYASAVREGRTLTLQQVASRFNLSQSTLRRRLAEEGRPFQKIKDQARESVARALLENSSRPIVEVANEVGFDDLANFRRTFMRWAGLSPAQYRLQSRGYESASGPLARATTTTEADPD